jgi:hypothetical protein
LVAVVVSMVSATGYAAVAASTSSRIQP